MNLRCPDACDRPRLGAQVVVFSRSASRSARATMVQVGLAYPQVGNTELPAMNRLQVP
jgi:hypothetical protein